MTVNLSGCGGGNNPPPVTPYMVDSNPRGMGPINGGGGGGGRGGIGANNYAYWHSWNALRMRHQSRCMLATYVVKWVY